MVNSKKDDESSWTGSRTTGIRQLRQALTSKQSRTSSTMDRFARGISLVRLAILTRITGVRPNKLT